MSDAFQVFTNGNTELTGLSMMLAEEPATSPDGDPDKLVGLLRDMDGLKHEIQERMRRVEAVKQAKALLREDTVRSEVLKQRLAEVRRSINQAQSQTMRSDERSGNSRPLCKSLQEASPSQISDRPEPMNSHLDDAAKPHSAQRVRVVNSEAYRTQIRAMYPDAVFPPGYLDETAGSHSISVEEGSELRRQLEEVNKAAQQAAESFTSTKQLLAQAEQAWKLANESVSEVKTLFERATIQLSEAKSKEEQAVNELKSTQQELTTAYQFASAAAQKQHAASEFFRKTNHWTVNAAALAWVATIWMAWVSFHAKFQVWVPSIATVFVMALAVFMARWSQREE